MKIALYFCSPFLLKSINQKKFLLIFSCFFLSYVGIAQINIDSLKKIVDSKLHDTIRSEAASRIAFELSDNDPDQSIIYGLLAKNIAEKIHHDRLKSLSRIRLALAYDTKKQYAISHELYQQAMSISQKSKDLVMLGKAQNNLALSYYLEGKLDSALYWHLQSLDSRKKTNNKKEIAQSLNNIGLIFRLKKDYTKAVAFYRQSLDIKREIDDENGMLFTLLNISYAYKEAKQFDSSIHYANACCNLATRLNTTKEYYEGLTNIGLSYNAMNRYRDALPLLQRVEKAKDADRDTKNYPGVIAGIAQAYVGLNNYDRAIEYANKALPLSISGNLIELTSDLHYILYQSFEAKQNYKVALQHFKEYNNYNDSLLNNANINNVNELTARYESQQKEQEISLLHASNKIKDEWIKAKNVEIILSILVILFAISVIYIFYQANQKAKKTSKELIEKNSIITHALQEKEILLKEIHHRVKNNLQVISSLLNLQSKTIKNEKALEAIKEGRDRVRNMAFIHQNLYQDENLTGVNMKEYIEKLVESLFKSYNIEKEKIELVYKIDDLKLDIETVMPVGLILNELISNALKHAFEETEKGMLKVVLQQNEEMLFLQVSDNGKGMPAVWKINQGNTLGYQIIQSFVNKLKAELSVVNDNGTNVRIIIKTQNHFI
jgi:two-component sensor histidine kinase